MSIEEIITRFTQHLILGLLIGILIAYLHYKVGPARLRRMTRTMMHRNSRRVFIRPYTHVNTSK
jgi:hypothetical protein